MKYLLLAACCAVSVASLPAQNISDALRYASTQYGGSARMIGSGGAFTALGADFGSLSQNPAGLAMFRSNEFMFSPVLRFANTSAALPNGQADREQASRFQFGNVGIVFNTTPDESSKWKTFNVGIGLNQLASYNQAIYYQGDANGTILNNWFDASKDAINAGGTGDDLDPYAGGLAYNANAIYLQDGVASYDFINDPNASVTRTHLINTTGNTNELVFSLAGNYDERLMIGATVGVPMIRYSLTGEYVESDPGGGLDGNVPYFDKLTYTDFLRTNGIGVNFKLGLNYKVSQAFRLGAAIHSPSFLRLTDNYDNTLSYTFEDGGGSNSSNADAPDGTFDYRLRTPFRAMMGGAVILKNKGFLSADIEWVDYSSSTFNLTADIANTGNQAFERELNNAIQRGYKSAVNVRLGGELAMDKLRLRAGYNLFGKAIEGEDGFNSAFTLGAGVRADRFYLDLAYRYRMTTGSVKAYNDAPLVETSSNLSDITVTVGFKF